MERTDLVPGRRRVSWFPSQEAAQALQSKTFVLTKIESAQDKNLAQ